MKALLLLFIYIWSVFGCIDEPLLLRNSVTLRLDSSGTVSLDPSQTLTKSTCPDLLYSLSTSLFTSLQIGVTKIKVETFYDMTLRASQYIDVYVIPSDFIGQEKVM